MIDKPLMKNVTFMLAHDLVTKEKVITQEIHM